MNVEDIRTRQKRPVTINRIRNLYTDIACVQETHDTITTKTQINEYVIYQGKANDENQWRRNHKYIVAHEP